jgi:hypothetical protein
VTGYHHHHYPVTSPPECIILWESLHFFFSSHKHSCCICGHSLHTFFCLLSLTWSLQWSFIQHTFFKLSKKSCCYPCIAHSFTTVTLIWPNSHVLFLASHLKYVRCHIIMLCPLVAHGGETSRLKYMYEHFQEAFTDKWQWGPPAWRTSLLKINMLCNIRL